MHSRISVIAQCSHERRVNPLQTTMVIRSLKRGDASAEVRENLVFPVSSTGYPHPPSALRRTKSALGSLVFLPVYPSSSTVPPPSYSLVQCIPLCSNYEKECSFGTRRGTHNGQQPLETIIDPRILL